MKASELRIGNWITDRGGKQWQIDHWDSINKVASKPDTTMCMGVLTETHPLTEYVDYLKPIPLTEEWLLKFGFENQGRWFAIMNYPIELYVSPDKMVYIGDELSIGYIEHVHQLQNLYFALTGEELTVNEK